MYYHYSEGYVHHSLEKGCTCPFATNNLGRKHPVIFREAWFSRRAYLRHIVRRNIQYRLFERIRFVRLEYYDYGIIGNFINKLANIVFGEFMPKNELVRIAIHPEQSKRKKFYE